MAALGSLVVSLGLDAAQYTSGLSKAEYQARKFGETIGNGIRTAAIGSTAALASLGVAAVAANAAFNKLLDGAAKFQDLAEETGASAAGIAGLAVAAATAGVSIESVAGSTNKLTKSLVGVDDESKAAGAALAALGINVKEFKALDPVAQYQAVGTALAGFADGAGKTAVAMALFGKSGAEQLKVLKALEEQGGATNILTQEQIALADEYRDKQARTTAVLELYASALASQAIPAVNEFTQTLLELAKELLGVSNAGDVLGQNTAVGEFATKAADFLAKLIDVTQYVGRAFVVLGDIIGNFAATASAVLSGNIADAINIQIDGARNLVKNIGAITDPVFSDSLAKTRAAMKQADADRNKYGFGNRPGSNKPAIDFSGAAKKGGAGRKDNSAAQEAKAQLSSDLDAIKNAQEAITNTYANQEKILEALRGAGLRDETQYYQEKQRLLALNATAQEDGLQKQIARLQQEKLSGKDAIDNTKKIADAEAALAKVRENSATQAQVLAIQQEAAYAKIKGAILSAQQAAQDFFDTTNRGYARELAGIGQGDKNRNMNSGITQIEDKYRQQRQDLQNQRAQAELAGTFTPEAQKQFDAQLGIINDFQTKAIDSYKNYYTAISEAQKNWLNGATEALHNYADEAENVAKHTQETVGNAFKGLEDQLTNLFTGKKFDVKALLGSIGSDLARNAIKENITGPLAKLGADFLGSGSGGAAGATGQAALAASTTATSAAMAALTAAATAASAALTSISLTSSLGGGGDILGDFIGTLGVGGMAGGGLVSPWGMTRVNENGPEMLDVNGKQYLMNGGNSARITANHKLGGGGGLNIYQSFAPGTDRRTTDQAARSAGLAAQRATARNG